MPKQQEQKESFGKFELLAGTHNQGAHVSGTRQRFTGRSKGRSTGDVITARSEKEAEFFRKYPDKFRELTQEMMGKNSRFGETGEPKAAPKPSRPPHMTDEESALLSPVQAKPGQGTDNDGKGDDAGDTGRVKGSPEAKDDEEQQQNTDGGQTQEVEEVDMDKLRAMPVRELLNWTRTHNVDIKGAVKKEDILKNIEKALSDS